LQFHYTGGTGLSVERDAQTLTDQELRSLGIAPVSRAPGEVDDNRKSVDANLAAAYKDLLFNLRLKQETAGGYVGMLDALGDQNQLVNRQIILDGEYRHALADGQFKGRLGFSQSEMSELFDLLPQGFSIPASFTRFVSSQPIQLGGAFFQTDLKSRRVSGEANWERAVGRRHTFTFGAGADHESTYGLLARSSLDLLTTQPLPDTSILGAVSDQSRRIFDVTRAPLFSLPGEEGLPELPGLVPEASRSVTSLYLQDAWRGPHRVAVTGGLRFDHYTDFGSFVNPRLALVWRAPRGLNLKLQYGRAVRTPTFLERFYTQPSLERGTALRPATINTLDLGAVYRHKSLRLAGTLYLGVLRDVLMRAPVEPGLTSAPVINVPGIDARGFELEATRALPRNRSLQLSYTFQHASYSDGGGRVEDVPQHLAHAAATFGVGKYLSCSPGLTLRGARARAQGDLRPDMKGYALFDVALRATGFHPSLELAALVQNLFDTEYFDPAPQAGLPGDYPRPGIGFSIKARYKF
jgi:iron complex outermembrane receptor protein